MLTCGIAIRLGAQIIVNPIQDWGGRGGGGIAVRLGAQIIVNPIQDWGEGGGANQFFP